MLPRVTWSALHKEGVRDRSESTCRSQRSASTGRGQRSDNLSESEVREYW